MSAEPQFEIVIHGALSTEEEWRTAAQAQEADLPALHEHEKELALLFKFNELSYRRSRMPSRLATRRLEKIAEDLGTRINRLLTASMRNYDLKQVIFQRDFQREKPAWIARLRQRDEAGKQQIHDVIMADDFINELNADAPGAMDKLKELISAQIKERGAVQ